MFSEFGDLLAVYLIQPEYDNSVDFEATIGGGGGLSVSPLMASVRCFLHHVQP